MSKISENEIVWTSNIFDRDTQNEVKYLKKNDSEEFEDSFYKNMSHSDFSFFVKRKYQSD